MEQTVPARAAAVAGEYLTFTLGREEYAIDILKVQEIRGYEPPTAIVDAPPFLKGVINLRGAIVPIVDLRIKFHLGEPRYDRFTVVIILNLGGRVVGVVVDGVSDVVALDAESLRPPPEFAGIASARHILGLGTLGSRMIIVLDIEGLMRSPDMGLSTDEF